MNHAFFDVTGRTALSLQGSESQDLLQRITTNDMTQLKKGGCIQTVFTNEKGRIVDVACVLQRSRGELLVVGQSSGRNELKLWIEKFIIMEDIRVVDLSAEATHLLLPYSDAFSREQIVQSAPGEIILVNETLGDEKLVHVVCGKELRVPIVEKLRAFGLSEHPGTDYEEYRVSNGIPGWPSELSLVSNPLEAGLFPLVSWTKGCYIGQEVIARLDTYKKVQRRLVRLHLEGMPTALPQTLFDGEIESGQITSALKMTGTGEIRGLGYVKTSADFRSGQAHFRKGDDRIGVKIEMTENQRPT